MRDILRDKYRILHEIGQGGMAIVYKGLDTSLDRDVAIKVLHPHLAARTDSRIRLQREAKAVAKLHHPNILEIYDYSGLDCDQSYIVTEYIRGETLKDFTDRHTPSLPEVGAMIVHEIASALGHAHDGGIIHRDIKPENIMIRDDGVLKLMDFGIAQIVDMQAMTVTGALVGSPAHMSPEHVEGKPLDFRADVFSAGTLLYLLCVGRLPFDSPSPHALLRQILEARYDDPRMHNPAVGRRLYNIITRCLECEPEDRYESIELLREDIADYLNELGLDDPAAELSEYFEDPHVAEATITRRVVDRLMERANRDSADGRVASALEAYNQVLALQGDRQDVLAQVQRLSSSRLRHRRMRRGLAATLVIGLISTGVWALRGSNQEPVPGPQVEQHVATMPASRPLPVPEAAPVTPSPRPSPETPAAVTTPTRPTVESAPREKVAARVVRGGADMITRARSGLELEPISLAELLRAERTAKRKKRQNRKNANKPAVHPSGPKPVETAGGVTFTIRNRQMAEIHFMGTVYPNGYTAKVTLPEGTAKKVRIHKPDCDECLDATYTLRVSKRTPKSIWYPLKFKPAQLVVNAPPGATIHAAGRVVRSGQPLVIKMGIKRKRTILVRVKRPGYKDGNHALHLVAGRTATRTLGAGAPIVKDKTSGAAQ